MKPETKANKIVKELDKFIEKDIMPDLIKKYPSILGMDKLKEIFLLGGWYGAFKAFQLKEKK